MDKYDMFVLGLGLGSILGMFIHGYTTCTLFVGGC